MNTYSCPKGHQSSEADFCSECGAKIGAGSAAALSNGAAAESPVLCPDCHAPHAHGTGDFCEVCGYNLSTGAHGDVAFAQSAAASAGASAPVETAAQSTIAPTPEKKWSIVATVDPALREDTSPEPPPDTGPVSFLVEKPETLIGRHSRARAIEPDISLDFDDAVSHRHAVITRLDDGSLSLRDIGSANGTRLNGSDLPPLTDASLKDGDQLTLGHWTRLTVRAE